MTKTIAITGTLTGFAGRALSPVIFMSKGWRILAFRRRETKFAP
ncbi:MAG: hypothetical protein Q9P01_20705 [Anaerolineae bacterium]|nr:hypothetical protein [Anaerolineae bacterium]